MTAYYCSQTVAQMGLTAPEHSAGQLFSHCWSEADGAALFQATVCFPLGDGRGARGQ